MQDILNMASIYCGGTADDVPLFCVGCGDVEHVHHSLFKAHFSFMEVSKKSVVSSLLLKLLSGQVLDNHIQEI